MNQIFYCPQDAVVGDVIPFYAQGEWSPAASWRVDGGVRLNLTNETRNTNSADGPDGDHRTNNRLSSFLGLSRRVAGDAWAFADYRNTFKPAAIDFGPDAEPDILQPETSQSYELGLKGHQLRDRLFWQASAFLMNIENAVRSHPAVESKAAMFRQMRTQAAAAAAKAPAAAAPKKKAKRAR